MSMTTEEEKNMTSMLDMVTYTYDTEIANYSLDEYEDLLDEDEDSLVRVLKFSRGEKTHLVVVTPYGQLKCVPKRVPQDLLIQICNSSIDLILDAVDG